MSKSSPLCASDIRTAFLLAGECRELGDDPLAWRQHWFRTSAELVGADIVVGVETAGHPRDMGPTEWGWENGFSQAGWEAALVEFRDHPDLILTPPLRRYLRRAVRRDGIALA